MTIIRKTLCGSIVFFAISASAQAGPTAQIFATGAAVGGTKPDSVTIGGGSVWIEYGNGADSVKPPGTDGSSTIVQYGFNGAVLHTYSIAGSVDGLKYDPVTGKVWALQNQDDNSQLSIIDPTTHTVSAPLKYGSPYVYGGGRGYDDVAFLNHNVYLSYTNPASGTDPVLQTLDQGNSPSGILTTHTILTAAQEGVPFPPAGPGPDTDSLKATPSGQLVLTSGADGSFTLITHPGAANQTLTFVQVKTPTGVDASSLDDVLFPSTTSGTLFFTNTGKSNDVLKLGLKGLSLDTAIVALGGTLNELAFVDLATGVATPLLTGLSSPHGLDFAVPEPSTWAMMLLGFAGLGYMGYRASAKRQAALPV
jgi:hypothetical protein